MMGADINMSRVKRNRTKKVLLVILVIILAILSAGAGYAYYQLGRMKYNNISKTNEDLGIKNVDEPKDIVEENVVNIALFGVDTGGKQRTVAHGDAMMILTIDEKNKKFKISSLMRDSYVEIENHGKTKLTHAYSYGGPELAIKTLNQNFDLDIRNYVTVDFVGLSSIIDCLGGVDIDVKKNEIKEVNKYMKEVASLKGEKPTPIRKSGLQTLNGNQATSYARIRHVGNGDFERIERQQMVLDCLAKKIQSAGPTKYLEVAWQLTPYVETSLTKADIIKLCSEVVTHGITDIDWIRFPLNEYLQGEMIDGVSYITFDMDVTKEQMHKFIYEDIKPEKKDIQNQTQSKSNDTNQKKQDQTQKKK